MTDRTQSQEFGFFYIFCYVLIPCLFIFFCYSQVFLFVSKFSGKVCPKGKKKHIQLAKSLFASFITYFICWMPFGSIYIIDHHDMLHPAAMVITIAFAHMNSSLNAFYYAYFSSSLRKGYANILRFLTYRKINSVKSPKNTWSSSIQSSLKI